MIPAADQTIAAQADAICLHPPCGKHFTPKPTHPHQKYCSIHCKNTAYNAEHKRASSDEGLAKSILRRLEDGPGTVEELRLDIGHCSHKSLGMAVKRLCDRGLAVRLYLLDGPRLGGPRPWVYGLAGISYDGKPSLKSRILAYLADGRATTSELGAALSVSGENSVSSAISDLRRAGKVRRVARLPSTNPHGGPMPWLYELGREAEVAVKPKHVPDPSRIAGHVYMKQFANWGASW